MMSCNPVTLLRGTPASPRGRAHDYSCTCLLWVAVTVSAAEGVRGLLLQGRRRSTNLVVGQFVETQAAATVDCDGPDDTLVAWYGTQTGASDAGFSSRWFTWIPPDDGADGQLEFVCVTLHFVLFFFCQKLVLKRGF